MPLYLTREVPKLWKKICSETAIQLKLILENVKNQLGGLIFQYIHGFAAREVYYLHQPGPLLHDIGFNLIPELGQEKGYISETIFAFIFISFLLWTFHPFMYQNKKIYTVLLWCRVLACLVASQILWIVTFYWIQLPGPNYHCREGSKLSQLPPPRSAIEVLLINFPQGVFNGCGDLIFSSHMFFTLTFVSTYQKHGRKRFVKQCAWLLAVVQSGLIVASRKHYTVDVLVAWYTVTLVIFFIDNKFVDTQINLLLARKVNFRSLRSIILCTLIRKVSSRLLGVNE